MSAQPGYLELVAEPDGLRYVDHPGTVLPIRERRATWRLRAALERVAAVQGGRPAVLWVHEAAARAWRLPADPAALARVLPAMPDDARSSDAWVRLSRDLHVAIPGYDGYFAGLPTPEDLGAALRTFRELTGTTFLYSAPATVLHLIGERFTGRPPSSAPPDVAYAQAAYAVPAHAWARQEDAADLVAALPYVRLFDRRGSYLAAWRSVELPDGEWRAGPIDLGYDDATAIARVAPGYYLVDLRALRPYFAVNCLPDPFLRAPRRTADGDHEASNDGPVWLTAPLAQLAAELAQEIGDTLAVQRSVTGARAVRPLDRPAERLADAVRTLEERTDPVSAAVLEAVKDGYKRATAHLEYGRRPPHPLARPAWRHTIVDRHVANTWRSIRKATRRPLAVGGVDSAVFPVSDEADIPAGLRADGTLGSWRRRGRLMARAQADRILRERGPFALIAALTGED